MSGVGLGAGSWNGLNPLNSGQIMRGQYAMANGASSFSVTGLAIGTINYIVLITVENTVAVTVRHLVATITAKTTTGFSFVTPQTTDHPEYKANWIIVKL